MPRGVPIIGSSERSPRPTSEVQEELRSAPQSEVLGVIPDSIVNPPAETSTTWVSEDAEGQSVPISVLEPPPPWEVGTQRNHTDARNYVECPKNILLRWANPTLVKQVGLRDWKPVPATGHRWFRLLNSQMQCPDNTVRKGGEGGDFLVWMYESWYAERVKAREARNATMTQSSIDRQHQFQEDANRGKFGPYVKGSGKPLHPTHTIQDVRPLEQT